MEADDVSVHARIGKRRLSGVKTIMAIVRLYQ